jgi:hypothetical protein
MFYVSRQEESGSYRIISTVSFNKNCVWDLTCRGWPVYGLLVSNGVAVLQTCLLLDQIIPGAAASLLFATLSWILGRSDLPMHAKWIRKYICMAGLLACCLMPVLHIILFPCSYWDWTSHQTGESISSLTSSLKDCWSVHWQKVNFPRGKRDQGLYGRWKCIVWQKLVLYCNVILFISNIMVNFP